MFWHWSPDLSTIFETIGAVFIKSCRLDRFPWLSLTNYPNRPLLSGGILNCIQCPYKAHVCKTGVFMCRGSQENVSNEFVSASPAVPRISCSCHLDGLWDGRQMTEQLLFCWVLLPGFIQNNTQHPCEIYVINFYFTYVPDFINLYRLHIWWLQFSRLF